MKVYRFNQVVGFIDRATWSELESLKKEINEAFTLGDLQRPSYKRLMFAIKHRQDLLDNKQNKRRRRKKQ